MVYTNMGKKGGNKTSKALNRFYHKSQSYIDEGGGEGSRRRRVSGAGFDIHRELSEITIAQQLPLVAKYLRDFPFDSLIGS